MFYVYDQICSQILRLHVPVAMDQCHGMDRYGKLYTQNKSITL